MRWFVAGDLNGFFGLVIDNLSVLSLLAAVLIGVFGYPAEIVFTHMFPGTALGVLVGNGIYARMAWGLAARTGRNDVTAMPLGIDAPTTIGMALLVLGPAFAAFKSDGLDEQTAAIATWHLGMAAMVVMGVVKLVLSFAGAWVGRIVPRAGLLGSIAGIALMFIGFIPIVEILRVPVIGFVGLGVVFYNVVAKRRLPGNVPGVLGALLIGAALYYILGPSGLLGPGYSPPGPLALRFALPIPSLDFASGLAALIPYLPLVLPFALLMVVGGINVTESARAAGDDYSTRDVLLTEAFATLVAGLCGGVAQTTPYIGQPAYKKMGAQIGYVAASGLFIGLGGVFGYLSNVIELLPLPILAPILIFVSIDIAIQAFEATDAKHAAAVAFSFFPPLASLLAIKLGDPKFVDPQRFASLMVSDHSGLPELAVIVVLGNGCIITSMIWAAFLVALIDRRSLAAIGSLLIAAVLTLFGIIHSVDAGGGIYWPWALTGMARIVMLQFAAAYAAMALILAVLAAAERGLTRG